MRSWSSASTLMAHIQHRFAFLVSVSLLSLLSVYCSVCWANINLMARTLDVGLNMEYRAIQRNVYWHIIYERRVHTISMCRLF